VVASPAAVLDGLDPTQDQFRIRLTNRQRQHGSCIGLKALGVLQTVRSHYDQAEDRLGLYCRSSSPLDFDRVITAITERYPATRIVEADWYAERRAHDLAIYKQGGLPEPYVAIQSLDRASEERGLQRGFEVPIDSGVTLYARLDKRGGYFHCRERTFGLDEVAPLVEILKRFDLSLSYSGDDNDHQHI
jgi:hypothetical protein